MISIEMFKLLPYSGRLLQQQAPVGRRCSRSVGGVQAAVNNRQLSVACAGSGAAG